MNRIDRILSDLRSTGSRALMPFICGGHPAPGSTASLLPALAHAGAHIVEVGIPFSDPIADGPVIAAAMHHALLTGATPAGVFAEIAKARQNPSCENLGVVAMMSVSIAWRLGPDAAIQLAKASGADGFIFPDLPLDEGQSLLAKVRDAGLTASLLIAPSTSPQRAEKIARASSGFIYLLARAGVTGERSDIPDIAHHVRRLRNITNLPIACGFGISTPSQVHAVVAQNLGDADAAIVGSALVRRLSDAHANQQSVEQTCTSFVQELARGLA